MVKAAVLIPLLAFGWTDAMPPKEYRGEAEATVFFLDAGAVHALCAPAVGAGPGVRVYACAGDGKDGKAVILLPDPCPYGEIGERYAQIACHEKGHALGWRHD